MILANIMTIALILEAIVIIVSSIRAYQKTHWFVYLLFILVGVGWGALYAFVFFFEPNGYDPVWFGQTFIRPLNVFTMGLISSILLYRAWYDDN